MMRGPSAWSVAVRKPEGDIAVEVHDLPRMPEKHRWLKWPFIRGVYVLGEQMGIGIKALMISANYQLEEEEEKPSDKAIRWTLGVALIVFMAFFILVPAFLSKMGGRWLDFSGNELLENLLEGGIRLGFLVGYVLAISLMKDIRRVFQYHGAEHKTIYAYENGDPLEPSYIDRYSTLHVRCGTNFLFIVVFLTILGHFFMDIWIEGLALRLAARILAIPVLAGTAYEVIKAASRKEHSLVFRIASIPGLAFQKVTTKQPTTDQIEVAIAAMEAVANLEQPTEVPEPESSDPSGASPT